MHVFFDAFPVFRKLQNNSYFVKSLSAIGFGTKCDHLDCHWNKLTSFVNLLFFLICMMSCYYFLFSQLF